MPLRVPLCVVEVTEVNQVTEVVGLRAAGRPVTAGQGRRGGKPNMKRLYAVAISLAMLIATPGFAAADTMVSPAARQQAIQYVIQRALSQRGVPFTYGGGDATGPTVGVQREADTTGLAAANPDPLVPGIPQTGIGVPQTSTGSGPAPATRVVGFDASGLVVYAFAGVGIKLPRSSGQQYLVGRKLLPSQALPGDLIFYGPEGADSVAMFIGNGQMIQTTDSGVTVSPVRTKDMAPYLSRIIEW